MIQYIRHIRALSCYRRRVLMTKRKDSKGRILKTGESQRKDGIYMYRYSDIRRQAENHLFQRFERAA